MLLQHFSEQLTAARKASGMTQEQLAEIMNVSRPIAGLIVASVQVRAAVVPDTIFKYL